MSLFSRSFITLAALLAAAPVAADLSSRSEVNRFIDEMVDEHAFKRSALRSLFADVELRQDIVEAISRPAESKPWHEYRQIFLTGSRIREGAEFYRRNAELLEEAESAYGVDPVVITAILGVETRYGRFAGSYRVIDSLSTLAFDYPPRSRFFRGQLREFLIMTREENRDPREFEGSYAGAMGQPQFIPSSFRNYAVDFDGDGRRDLWDNTHDVVGSVANYFKRHHWRHGEAVAHQAKVRGERYRKAVALGMKPKLTAGELADYGVYPEAELNPDTPVAVISLEGGEGPEIWVVQNNFYTITRYNHSPLYAMAVHQLAEGIRREIAR